MECEHPRRPAALALILAALAGGCTGPPPGPNLSPKADEDPARFEAAVRETGAMEASNREAERRFMRRGRVAPPGR